MSEPAAIIGDLAICGREPIHVPGAIQPHGALIAFSPIENGRILQVSENVPAMLGIEVAKALAGKLEDLFDAASVAAILASLNTGDLGELPLEISSSGAKRRTFDGLVHISGSSAVLELEPSDSPAFAQASRRAVAALREITSKLHAVSGLEDMFKAATEIVKRATGFDRVMIYRFDAEWNGEVIVEVREPDIEPYLGLWYPATDIPEQARRLYTQNWLRMIPDAGYVPVVLVPKLNPVTGLPLDLSESMLRSVSPVHLEYLRNMGVGASMSMSLIVSGRLWGLIACHHRSPHALPYAMRAACEVIAKTVSLEIGAHEQRSSVEARLGAKGVQTAFFDLISSEENVTDAMVRYAPKLSALVEASGVAVCFGEKVEVAGLTPPLLAIMDLRRWIHGREDRAVFSSDRLSSVYSPARDYISVASGVLAVALSDAVDNYLFFFRPEVIATVHWAGNPSKAAEREEDGSVRIHPRKSFEAWKEVVLGRSKPWTSIDMEVAREVRDAISALILRRTDRLLALNDELQRKNTDINSFAHMASHDLKQPLRNMRNLSEMILDSAQSVLDADTKRRVTTIREQAVRGEELINALREYSKTGRVVLTLDHYPVDAILDEAIELLRPAIEVEKVEIRRPAPLPSALCDRLAVRQIFYNLISNAIKYSQSEQKWVEIGFDGAIEGGAYFVADNGIGIRARQQNAIFQMFRRMHEPHEYGGGLGVGLAIVKTFVERHGGRVWVQSTPGRGSVFRFTLAPYVRAI